ncbi:aminotransferase class IV [Maricaulaceae bacterium EIL42A08]|nr:aminotransferase class IV [Maricaulaceae bacterium EIL42A08]
MAKVWFNGEICEAEEARLGVDDRGFLLGEAAFETMRWSAGVIRRWDHHATRLKSGLEYLGLPAPDLESIVAAAEALAKAEGLSEGVLRLTVSGGRGAGFEPSSERTPTCLLTLTPRHESLEAIRLAVVERYPRSASPGHHFKLSGYGENLAARREARARGADMAVMPGPDGQAPVCCDVANLFWMSADGQVVTPSVEAGALPGTTRAAILEAAEAAGLGIFIAGATTPIFSDAVAACVTNAVMGCVPVASVDGRKLDVRHPVLAQLIALENSAA